MKMTSKGQVTIPPAMRKKHRLTPDCEVDVIDRPDGLLVVRADRSLKRTPLDALLDGSK